MGREGRGKGSGGDALLRDSYGETGAVSGVLRPLGPAWPWRGGFLGLCWALCPSRSEQVLLSSASTHPSIHSTGQLFIPASIRPPVHPSSIHLSARSPIHLSIQPPVHLSIHPPPIHPLTHPSSIHPSTHPSIHLSFHSSVHPSVHPPTHLASHPYLHPSTCPPVTPSIPLTDSS